MSVRSPFIFTSPRSRGEVERSEGEGLPPRIGLVERAAQPGQLPPGGEREETALRPEALLSVRSGCSTAEAQRTLARAFCHSGLDTPELDARVLLQASLGLDRAGLMRAAHEPLSGADAAAITAAAVRRLAREPLAYIVGEKEFWGLPLRVTPDTLTPRPDTETVVEAAFAEIDAAGMREHPLRIADLGTGSGAILLALLSELPHAFGVGTDICAAALAVARGNAERLALARRAAFCIGDFAAALGSHFDLIVSNPPYIASGDIASLAAEVRDHEPRRALDGGTDGLAAYRKIAADATRLLTPTGRLLVEIGRGQAADVAGVLTSAGLIPVRRPALDLAGVPRALTYGRG